MEEFYDVKPNTIAPSATQIFALFPAFKSIMNDMLVQVKQILYYLLALSWEHFLKLRRCESKNAQKIEFLYKETVDSYVSMA